MPATSTSPVKILLDLGIDLDNLSSEEDYLSALMEAAATIEVANKGKGDGRSAILRKEIVAVRKTRKAAAPSKGMKASYKKISASSFKGGAITKRPAQGKGINNIFSAGASQGEGGDLLVIKEKVVSIEALLGEQYRLQEDNAKDAKQEAEKKRRSLKERLLEGSGKVFDGVKKATSKVLKPFKSVWENIIGFIKKILLGAILFKILKWTSNPENQGKIESIFKFLKDWWPVLLTAYLAFGNGVSKFVLKLTGKLVMWSAKLLKTVIPALWKAVVAMGPKGWLALGLTAGAVGLGVYMSRKEEGEDLEESEGDEVQKFATGGYVSGPGGVDQVPARLTAGEFVMSKGAVQKYGADTLASMNSMGGGTNRPTLMRGYNEGGKATPMSMDDLIAAAGPSMMAFMEQHNALIDSDPEFYGEHMRIEMDRDGKMLNFGKVITNMSEWAFNEGNQMLIENEAIEPEVKEALLKEMDYVRRQTLENPNFKADYAFDINKNIPGTAANRLFLRAQADTTSPAALAGMSARDRALAMNRRGYFGGGLVQGFQGGGGVELIGPAEGWGKGKAGSKKFSGAQLKGLLDSQKGIGATPVKKTPIISRPIKKIQTISPPITAPKVTVVNQPGTEEVDAAQAQLPPQGNREIPTFDAAAIRSIRKMEVLGISL